MKTSPVEHLDEAVKAWISNDLPMSEKESLSPALLNALHDRFASKIEAQEPEAPKPTPTPKPAPKPIPEPPKPAAKKLVAKAKRSKPKLKAKSKKTRH